MEFGARRWRLTALLGVGVAALALVVTLINTLPSGGGSTEGTSRDGDKVHGTPAVPPKNTGPEVGWGFTHTQFSADEGSGDATQRVEGLLAQRAVPQIQHIMGWGPATPSPSRGVTTSRRWTAASTSSASPAARRWSPCAAPRTG
ncbi:hypothetical protein SAV31267_024140 [Streptomyces avermitilis]|uniref:Uncharacterized protein n=1 Tax=Streptomyces avermitilis TaxID=33903 RepID=A0A4D4MNA4_STRAX|nr:hypothetical protein SAV31267_024140 [Streptomyces avermitilis]